MNDNEAPQIMQTFDRTITKVFGPGCVYGIFILAPPSKEGNTSSFFSNAEPVDIIPVLEKELASVRRAAEDSGYTLENGNHPPPKGTQ